MKTREQVEAELAKHKAWLDEEEGMGSAEEGVETGWEQALEWVLDGT